MNRNEQIKLLATAFNNIGVGSLLAGIVVPWIDYGECNLFMLGIPPS